MDDSDGESADLIIDAGDLAPPFINPDSCVDTSYKRVMTFIRPKNPDEHLVFQIADVVVYMKYVREVRDIKLLVAGGLMLARMHDPAAYAEVIQKAIDAEAGDVFIPVEDMGVFLNCDREYLQTQTVTVPTDADGNPAWALIEWYQQDADGDLHAAGSPSFTMEERLHWLNFVDSSGADIEEESPPAHGNLLWAFETGGYVGSVAITPDGSRVAVGSTDDSDVGNAYLFDGGGNLIWSFETVGEVTSVAISPDGSQVAMGSHDGNAYLLGGGGNLLSSIETRLFARSTAVTADGSRVVVGSIDSNAYLLDGGGNLLWSFETGDFVWSVASRPTGREWR